MGAINREQMYNSAETNLLITYHFFAITRPVGLPVTLFLGDGNKLAVSEKLEEVPWPTFLRSSCLECSLLETVRQDYFSFSSSDDRLTTLSYHRQKVHGNHLTGERVA